jgi:hypothetical protein
MLATGRAESMSSAPETLDEQAKLGIVLGVVGGTLAAGLAAFGLWKICRRQTLKAVEVHDMPELGTTDPDVDPESIVLS